jgi:hypothetical protein
MKQLFETPKMQKFQNIAKRTFAENNVYDLDAVEIGWKIAEGRVIEYNGATMEITGCPQRMLYDVTTNMPSKNVVNHKGQLNLQQIAMLILTKNAIVHYSM